MINDALLSPPDSGLPEVPFHEAVREVEATLPTSLPEKPSDLLFALDIDGTLKGRKGISARTKEAFARAQRSGASVVIATGRGADSTRPVVEELGSWGAWTVCSNGAVTLKWGANPGRNSEHHVVGRHEFDPRPAALKLLQALPETLLGVDHETHGMHVSGLFPKGELLRQTRAEDLSELLSRPVTKLVGRAPWLTRDEFAQIVEKIPFTGVEYAVGWSSWIDFGPPGVTKATGLQAIVEHLGISSNATVAVGDGANDMDMLSWAAHGVAMGGAPRKVRNAADAVTAPVEHDGAAAVIEAVLRQY